MDSTTDWIIAIGTIVLAIAALYGMFIEYRRRLTIKRKSYLTKQVSKFSDDLTFSFSKLKENLEKCPCPDSRPTKTHSDSTQNMRIFAYEINASVAATIFTSEALEYLDSGDDEIITTSKIHRGFHIFCRNKRYTKKNQLLVARINKLSKSVDNMYDEVIRAKGDVQFKTVLKFYLDIKDDVSGVENAIR